MHSWCNKVHPHTNKEWKKEANTWGLALRMITTYLLYIKRKGHIFSTSKEKDMSHQTKAHEFVPSKTKSISHMLLKYLSWYLKKDSFLWQY
jgi:hypothetical protein